MADEIKLIDVRHPEWVDMASQWYKWRLVYEGGDCFVEAYLQKHSKMEDSGDYFLRKQITPSAAFAKSAINDIKNSIFQRMADVGRRGGPQAYQDAVSGKGMGVDLHGKSMTEYLGMEVLAELLTMKEVGIFVDMPPIEGNTMYDQVGKVPYCYTYTAEQLLSWCWRQDKPNEFQAVLLQDTLDDCHPDTGLPMGSWCRYRHCWISPEDGKCHVQCYNDECTPVTLEGVPDGASEYIIDLPYIPLVYVEITDSLLKDVANAQIALMNLDSSDVSYLLKAGHPIYTEQITQIEAMQQMRQASGDSDGTEEEGETAVDREIRVGVMQGRTYTGDQAPKFIHPSSEPINASVAKQKVLKDDIRQLVNLAVTNLKPAMASAESKGMDERSLEAGLSYLGLVLEHAENTLARIYSDYLGSTDIAIVSYPKTYSLQSETDRRTDAKELMELRLALPSKTFQDLIGDKIAMSLFGGKRSTEELDTISKEIRSSETVTSIFKEIMEMVLNGICSKAHAAKILRIPESVVAQAEKEHVDRAKAIAEAQAPPPGEDLGARGVKDLSVDPKAAASSEKTASRDTTLAVSTKEPVRGEGK